VRDEHPVDAVDEELIAESVHREAQLITLMLPTRRKDAIALSMMPLACSGAGTRQRQAEPEQLDQIAAGAPKRSRSGTP